MGSRITIGQYINGNSFVHRLDPRTKILASIIFMIMIFFIEKWFGFLPFLLYICTVIYLAKIPIKRLIKGLKPIWIILIFTFLINALSIDGKTLFRIWIFNFTYEGTIKALFISVRIILLVVGTSLMTLTTNPLAMTDAIEYGLKPLNKIKFPSHALAMTISIALRFIPTLYEESDRIMKAQRARGADFEDKNLIKRGMSYIPIMVPLFLNAYKRAEELGIAMESRCYSGGEGRTRLNPLKAKKIDYLSIIVVFSIFLLTILVF